jgi:hypothetical protein
MNEEQKQKVKERWNKMRLEEFFTEKTWNTFSDWWLSELDQVGEAVREETIKGIREKINNMAIETVGDSAKTVDQILSLFSEELKDNNKQ